MFLLTKSEQTNTGFTVKAEQILPKVKKVWLVINLLMPSFPIYWMLVDVVFLKGEGLGSLDEGCSVLPWGCTLPACGTQERKEWQFLPRKQPCPRSQGVGGSRTQAQRWPRAQQDSSGCQKEQEADAWPGSVSLRQWKKQFLCGCAGGICSKPENGRVD